DPDLSAFRRDQSAEHRHGGGLAGAVGAKQSQRFALGDPQRYVVNRDEPAERLPKADGFEHQKTLTPEPSPPAGHTASIRPACRAANAVELERPPAVGNNRASTPANPVTTTATPSAAEMDVRLPTPVGVIWMALLVRNMAYPSRNTPTPTSAAVTDCRRVKSA